MELLAVLGTRVTRVLEAISASVWRLKWFTIWSIHSNQNEQQRFKFNVLTHDAMREMVLAERGSLSV